MSEELDNAPENEASQDEARTETATETKARKTDKTLIGVIVAMAVVIVILIIALVLKGGDDGKNNGKDKKTTAASTNSNAVTTLPDGENQAQTTTTAPSENNGEGEASSTTTEDSNNGSEAYVFSYSSGNSWNDGSKTMYGMEMSITNNYADKNVGDWELVLEIEGLADVTGWNGVYTVDGNRLIIKNDEHNGNISASQSTAFGCNLGVNGELNIISATLNGEACEIVKGSVAHNSQNNNNNQNSNNNQNAAVDVEELLERSENAVQGDDWLFTDGKNIVDKNGKKVWITGVNWFGYNTGTNTFDGLWNSQLKPTVEAIADHGFNLIRVPISAELINQWANGEYPQANYNNAYNTELNSMNSLEIFEYFLKLAEENGIKVMPDIHSAETNASGHVVNLWCTDRISVEEYYSALEWIAERYKNNDTIVAIDLKNEPHGKPYEGDAAAIWNDSTDANNWKQVAETAAARIFAKNPNVLVLVEGIEIYPVDIKANGDFSSTDEKDYFFNWWGGNLRGVADFPVDLGKYQNKLVYSPHDYGPTVYKQPWFEGDYSFDSLMADCWKENWFYIYEENIAPLLIGEWGGFMKEPNLKWMTCMRRLIKENHLNHTFWCFNANSGDTGGLVLDDFTTWDEEKYAFVKEVLWQENGKFVGLDHAIPLGDNGITLSEAKGL